MHESRPDESGTLVFTLLASVSSGVLPILAFSNLGISDFLHAMAWILRRNDRSRSKFDAPCAASIVQRMTALLVSRMQNLIAIEHYGYIACDCIQFSFQSGFRSLTYLKFRGCWNTGIRTFKDLHSSTCLNLQSPVGDQIHMETCRKIHCRMHMCGSTG